MREERCPVHRKWAELLRMCNRIYFGNGRVLLLLYFLREWTEHTYTLTCCARLRDLCGSSWRGVRLTTPRADLAGVVSAPGLNVCVRSKWNMQVVLDCRFVLFFNFILLCVRTCVCLRLQRRACGHWGAKTAPERLWMSLICSLSCRLAAFSLQLITIVLRAHVLCTVAPPATFSEVGHWAVVAGVLETGNQ